MADWAHEWTDDEIERLERGFRRQYNQAAREMRERLEDMMKDFDKKNADWKKRVSDGKASKKDYDEWLQGQLTDQDLVRGMSIELAKQANEANQLAMQTINDTIPSVFAENANYAAFGIEQSIGKNTHSFDLYDQDTVRRLIAEQPELLPPLQRPRMDNGRDLRWNRQKFASAITQSILQGESIPRAAERIGRVMRTNEAAAVRAARTAITGAENAGRVDSYKRAERIGIELEQEWMATFDNRTRMSHRELHGQHVPVGKYFVASRTTGNKLLYPGDPTADPSEVYNCFLGETTVATDSQIEKSYCHEYVGKLVTIDTATGIHFTCTPNHPILTTNGWVAAELLHDGDDLLVTGVRDTKLPWRNPNVNHVLPSMKALHELLRVFSSKRATGLSVDFHGDVATSNVEVVAKEGLLRLHRDVRLRKGLLELVLKRADSSGLGKRSPMKGLSRIVSSASSIMRSLCVCAPFLWGHGLHADIHRLGTSTGFDSSVTKYTVDNLPAETMVRSELLSGLPRQVLVDEVISVKVSSTRGTQVYNLQTENGYYFANGVSNDKFIIAKNCRCTLVAWFPDIEQEEKPLWTDWEDGTTYDEWKAGRAHEAERKETPVVVDGKDILGTWKRRSSEFDFEIDDIIDAQGFNGKPRVVNADEYDQLVKQSNGGNGIVMQRTYSAPDKETLDAYRDMLYEGRWYVDCSKGGSAHGQGMYTVSDTGYDVTSAMERQMEHYQELYAQNGTGSMSYVENMTLDSTANVTTKARLCREYARKLESEGRGDYEDLFDTLADNEGKRYIGDDVLDIGAYAAARGYDAYSLRDPDSRATYTVVLNRTKLIIRKP